MIRAGAIAAAALLILEGGLRLTPRPPEPRTDPYYESFLRENEGRFFRRERAAGEAVLVQVPVAFKSVLGQRIDAVKPPETTRVVVLGETNAENMAPFLAAPTRGASDSVEVVSIAAGGASLELVRRRLDEVRELQPDAVVFLFGQNLFFRHRPYRPWAIKLRAALRRSRVLSLVVPPEPARVFPEYWNDPAERLAALDRLLADLDATLKGIPLVVLTSPSNLRFPPWSFGGERQDPAYLAALRLRDEGLKAEAVAAMRDLVRAAPSALWRYTLASWLEEDGRRDEAARWYREARDADPVRKRALTAANDLVRRAGNAHSWRFIDADARLAARTGGVPGWEFFRDDQHLNDRTLDFLARLVMEVLRDGPMPEFPIPVTPLPAPMTFREQLASMRLTFGAPSIELAPAWTSLALHARASPAEMESAALAADEASRPGLQYAFAEAAWRRGDRAAARRMIKAAERSPIWGDWAGELRARFDRREKARR